LWVDVPARLELPIGPINWQFTSTSTGVWWDCVGLPAGVVIDHQTGVLSGEAEVGGDWVCQVTAATYNAMTWHTLVIQTTAPIIPPISYIRAASFDDIRVEELPWDRGPNPRVVAFADVRGVAPTLRVPVPGVRDMTTRTPA
jgi:hypothetical protein